MNFSDGVLKNEEKAIYKLRQLYRQYGYSRYKVSKFEEYDLYAHNKSFLVSDQVLTFTDTNGKLMALKPDVTLSIIKNVENAGESTHKLYYNETVYRTSRDSDGFREIMQTGLECIGKIDLYAVCEVLMLAERSLGLISEDYILDISHMGILTGLLESEGIPSQSSETLLGLVASKNIAAIRSFCAQKEFSESFCEALCSLTDLYGPLTDVLPKIKPYVRGEKMEAAYGELADVTKVMQGFGSAQRMYLDLSMVSDMNYYNDIVFRGFLNGVPDGILSGGRYDSLVRKMGKKADAIGFAVYLDFLERFGEDVAPYDADVLLVYDESAETADVIEAVKQLRADGLCVRVQSTSESSLRYRKLIRMTKTGMEVTEL